jgi:endonuclease/exonuclease/phosphatase family metal-dependent hydrolase
VATVRFASFNLHAGIDGWGRPFDPVIACERLEADVLCLQEVWFYDDDKGLSQEIATALGYDEVHYVMAGGRRLSPQPEAPASWGPPLGSEAARSTLFFDTERPLKERTLQSQRYKEASPGRFGLAVLSRLPVVRSEVIDLGRLRDDPVHRAALVTEVATAAGPLAVANTHMSHLTKGSLWQFHLLRRALEATRARGRAVLAGDMNLWGPPLVALLPGWHRAVKGPTWPAGRPHSQLDHLLVTADLAVRESAVNPPSGSDHRPVSALVALEGPPAP